MTTLESLTEQMLALSLRERQLLLRAIVDSFDVEVDPDREAAIIRECEARLDAYDRGEMDAVDADEFHAELRAELLRRHG